jgi:hypothetical protein
VTASARSLPGGCCKATIRIGFHELNGYGEKIWSSGKIGVQVLIDPLDHFAWREIVSELYSGVGRTTTTMKKTAIIMNQEKDGSRAAEEGGSPSQLIDERIRELGDWRGEMLARLRALIKEADPEVVEEWKWRGVPVWSHDGIICTGETYKGVVKMTFAKGASLADPSGLFNSSLEGNTRRAIDFREGGRIDEQALQALFRAAVALNGATRAGRARKTRSA